MLILPLSGPSGPGELVKESINSTVLRLQGETFRGDTTRVVANAELQNRSLAEPQSCRTAGLQDCMQQFSSSVVNPLPRFEAK